MASLLALFNSLKKPGKSVTFILSTKGSEVTAELEVKLINAKSLLTFFTLLTLLTLSTLFTLLTLLTLLYY